MKRIITLFAILLISLLCFASCNNTNESTTEVETDETFIKLNELIDVADNNYNLNIIVQSKNGMKTTYSYKVRETGGTKTVHQTTEVINSFIISNGTIKAPSSYSTVTEKNLTAAEIKFGNYDLPSFNFSSKTLGSYTELGTIFESSIKSLKNFTGINIAGTNATVKVIYTYTAISKITVTYTSLEGSAVTLEYVLN